ncbi:MAG: glycosyltransferase family 4 protein, partial [Clostridiales Family XIII bacterium]|nr:glycosyltransferase family 4 protein [Clostridiales Family XIII bacterium]
MKTVWIFNHYAAPPSVSTAIRHYNFGKYLMKADYGVKIFAASAVHNSSVQFIRNRKPYLAYDDEKVPFVFIRTRQYAGNGIGRILNILDYYRRLFKAIKHFEKPDVILASSFHPLTCVAGIKIAKKLHIPCICEVRDLWPESLIVYKGLRRSNLIVKALSRTEQWIYEHADKLIFTMEGGIDYIKEHGINVNEEDVLYINNGVDLEAFHRNAELFQVSDVDLSDEDQFKVVYTGSIRFVNAVGDLVAVAEILRQQAPKVKLLIWGTGTDAEKISADISRRGLNNIILKGSASKNEIPSILSQSDATLLHSRSSSILKYGISQNKLFEYLAAAKPVISTLDFNYNFIATDHAGITAWSESPDDIAAAILELSNC